MIQIMLTRAKKLGSLCLLRAAFCVAFFCNVDTEIAAAQGVFSDLYENWQVVCVNQSTTGCVATQTVKTPRPNRIPDLLLSITIYRSADSDNLQMSVTTPTNVSLKSGVRFKIDGSDVANLTYLRCYGHPGGCVAHTELNLDAIQKLYYGREATFILSTDSGLVYNVRMNLEGFNLALPFLRNSGILHAEEGKGPATANLIPQATRSDSFFDDLASIFFYGFVSAEPPRRQPAALIRHKTRYNAQYYNWWVKCDAQGLAEMWCRLGQYTTPIQGEAATRPDMEVRVEKEKDGRNFKVTVETPIAVLLPSGLILSIDAQPHGRQEFRTCFADICVAEFILDEALIKQMDAGKKIRFDFIDRHNKPASAEITLDGFGAGLAKLKSIPSPDK